MLAGTVKRAGVCTTPRPPKSQIRWNSPAADPYQRPGMTLVALCLTMVLASWGWPGGLPRLWTQGQGIPWHAERAPGQVVEPTKSPLMRLPAGTGSGGGMVVECLRLGSGRPAPT